MGFKPCFLYSIQNLQLLTQQHLSQQTQVILDLLWNLQLIPTFNSGVDFILHHLQGSQLSNNRHSNRNLSNCCEFTLQPVFHTYVDLPPFYGIQTNKTCTSIFLYTCSNKDSLAWTCPQAPISHEAILSCKVCMYMYGGGIATEPVCTHTSLRCCNIIPSYL